MSDRFGLLQLAMSGSFGDPGTNAIGDPALDKLAAFLKAAINSDTGLGWAAVHPVIVPPAATSVPVVFALTHNPDDAEFTDNKLPALFVWRSDLLKATPITQDWSRQVWRIAVLWVQPHATYEKARFRDAFHNAVSKSITLAIDAGRHSAWVVAGDTDPKAATWGSFLLAQMNATQLHVVDAKKHPLTVQKANGVQPYEALLVTLELVEVNENLYDGYDAISHVQGNLTLGETPLTIASFTLLSAVTGVLPATGSTAGGLAITISGRQFWEDTDVGTLSVTLGGVACTSVVLVDETTITAVTPATTAGAKTVRVVLPNGAVASLATAFTYS